MEWIKVVDKLPTNNIGEQVKVLMYTDKWPSPMYGLYTCMHDGDGLWFEYDQINDKFADFEIVPTYYCIINTNDIYKNRNMHQSESMLDYVQRKLRCDIVKKSTISDDLKIAKSILSELASGKNKNPSYFLIERLHTYLKEMLA